MFERHFGRWVRSDLFGGRGAVSVGDLLGKTAAPPFAAVLACELAPGGSVGVHHQQEAHEVVIGVSGTGRASVNGAPSELVSGSVVYLEHGATLALENLSADAPLVYLIVKAKGHG